MVKIYILIKHNFDSTVCKKLFSKTNEVNNVTSSIESKNNPSNKSKAGAKIIADKV